MNSVKQALAEAAAAEGVSLAEAFDQIETGSLRRGPASDVRMRIYVRMRRPRNGIVFSYPEIAIACGVSHASVVSAVQRYRRELLERAVDAIRGMLLTHPPCAERIGAEGSEARRRQEEQEAAIDAAMAVLNDAKDVPK